MSKKYTIPLNAVVKEFSLEVLYAPENMGAILVERDDVNRPGLPLTGFFEHFEEQRIQIIGNVEHQYLERLPVHERHARLEGFYEHKPVAVILCNGLYLFDEMQEMTKKYDIPLLRTEETTSSFTSALISYLSVQLAPRITRHGVLVEVYGEGILILGDSGVGKSETAIELVKRGHRLIADDAVEIKRVSAKTLVGSAPENIRHYVELRGIGIVDVRRIFGMGAVKISERIDMVIKMEPWEQGKMYDRLGLDQETMDIMGIEVPVTTIPVKPGRNLAIILEIAAMNNRQKKMGYDTALEFTKKLMGDMGLSAEDIQSIK